KWRAQGDAAEEARGPEAGQEDRGEGRLKPINDGRSGAGVPEALLAARVGIVPAEVRAGRRARPRGRGGRADEPDRRSSRHRPADRPPVAAGPGPAAVISAAVDARAVNVAIDVTVDVAISVAVH